MTPGTTLARAARVPARTFELKKGACRMSELTVQHTRPTCTSDPANSYICWACSDAMHAFCAVIFAEPQRQLYSALCKNLNLREKPLGCVTLLSGIQG